MIAFDEKALEAAPWVMIARPDISETVQPHERGPWPKGIYWAFAFGLSLAMWGWVLYLLLF